MEVRQVFGFSVMVQPMSPSFWMLRSSEARSSLCELHPVLIRLMLTNKVQGVARLVNFFIPTDEDDTILVRNAQNEQANYTLTVRDPLTPVPP